MLGVLTIDLDQVRADPAVPAQLAPSLEDLRNRISEITTDIHGLSHRLHSSTLDYLGLIPAIQRLVDDFSARHGIAIEFSHADVPRLPSEAALCLFRVTEESLTNIGKHSGATSASIRVAGSEQGLRLTVEDSGVGFDSASPEQGEGLGFVSMRERLRVLRGRVRVHSVPMRGTTVDVFVPAASLRTESTAPLHTSPRPAAQTDAGSA
jgi:signal transduction histidine kinase